MKEIVIIMGIQGAGKSSIVNEYVSAGYTRMNRDNQGGSLTQLNTAIEIQISKGIERFVLDNTYGTIESRRDVIDLARKCGCIVKCVWKTTKIEDAQYNASYRILKKFVFDTSPKFKVHEILGPNCAKLGKDQCCVPSIAQFAYRKGFETPTLAEGFSSIEKVEFKRKSTTYTNKAVILDYDGTLRETKSGKKYPIDADDIKILPKRQEILQKYFSQGFRLLGVSNQSGIEKGDLSEQVAIDCFNRTNQLLGFDIDVQFCPHHSFPIRCYCRKPLPGLGVYLIETHKLNPSQCIMVGDSTSDKTFASRCGFSYQPAEIFFK
jgi:HAD superfamily hydrolase (TIGR01662 family)